MPIKHNLGKKINYIRLRNGHQKGDKKLIVRAWKIQNLEIFYHEVALEVNFVYRDNADKQRKTVID